MHVIFSSENTHYMWWQAEFLAFTYDRAGMTAPLTAIVGRTSEPAYLFPCNIFDASNYSRAVSDKVLLPLNKPGGIGEWAESSSTDELVFIIEPDSIFIDVVPEPTSLPKGQAYAQEVGYLDSRLKSSRVVLNRHCSKELRTRVQPVGLYIVIHRSDLAELTRRWWQKTIDIFSDDKCREALGDNGWISDMWGYVIAAAELGLQHKIAMFSQHTGSDTTIAPIIHYCYPVVKKKLNQLSSKREMSFWSKWTYKPWDEPPVLSGVTAEGDILLTHLAELAALRRASDVSLRQIRE